MSSEEALSWAVRVLVVAGCDEISDCLTTELSRRGHRVTVVRDAAAAIATYLPAPHPMVIIDDRLGTESGIALARRLRALPGGPKSAVLAIAGDPTRADLEAVLRGDVDDWLIHPIDPSTLEYRLRATAWRAWERQARWRAEEDLRKLSGRLTALLGASRDPIVCLDDGGVIEAFNPAAEQLFGYASSEVLGRSLAMLMSSPDAARAAASGPAGSGSGGFMGRRKDGSTFWLEVALRETEVGDRCLFTMRLQPIAGAELRSDPAQLGGALLPSRERPLVGLASRAAGRELEHARTALPELDRLAEGIARSA